MSYLNKFHHQIIGSNHHPKLIFLHGLMGSGNNWRRITAKFESTFQILTYDQRGHGRSFHPEAGYTSQDYSEDLYQILKELGWNKVILVGHSMGGRNAIEFAAEHSDMVTQLVVEDIGVTPNKASVQKIEELLNSVPTPFGSKREAREFFQNDFVGLHPNNPQAQAISVFLYSNIIESKEGRADWRFFKEGVLESARQGPQEKRWAQWESLKMPLLLVRGAQSTDLSEAEYLEMLSRNPQAKGVVVENSGHWVHFDQPLEFIALIEKFILKSR